ncbi:hypothetical protein [Anaplasma centrale]|nr:hypothetical protein [Anaplasma centrale]
MVPTGNASTIPDCVLIRLSPVEWSSLQMHRDLEHIKEMRDSGRVNSPQLFYCNDRFHILARNGEIFRCESAGIVPAEYPSDAITRGDTWMLLRPRLPEGQQIIAPIYSRDANREMASFPHGIHYSAAHCGTLEGVIKKMMFDRNFQVPESLESRRQILHRYVALHYNLARASAKVQKGGLLPEAVRTFMSSPAGAGFARDLLDYRAECQAITEQDEHMTPEHVVFLYDALAALDSLDQTEILRSDGTSKELVCTLYSLSGATSLLREESEVVPRSVSGYTEELTAQFLADANLRGALIALVVHKVAEVIRAEQSQDQSEGGRKNVPPLEQVLARLSSRRGMPWICRAIPGLIESVATAVLGCCVMRDVNYLHSISAEVVSQLHIIPGFDGVPTGDRVATEGAEISACHEKLCSDTADSAELRPLIVAEAAQRSAMEQGSATIGGKENFLEAVTEQYRNSHEVANVAGRVAIIKNSISTLTRDAVEEVVAHAAASWLKQEFGDVTRNYLNVLGRNDVGADKYIARWLEDSYTLRGELPISSAFSTEIRDAIFRPREIDVLAMSGGLRPAFGDLLSPQFLVAGSQTPASSTPFDGAEAERSTLSHSGEENLSAPDSDSRAQPEMANVSLGQRPLPRQIRPRSFSDSAITVAEANDRGTARNVVDDISSDRVIFFLRPVNDAVIWEDVAIAERIAAMRDRANESDAPQIFGVGDSFYVVGHNGNLFKLVAANTLRAGQAASSIAIPDGASWVLVRTDIGDDNIRIASRPNFTLTIDNEHNFPRDLFYTIAHNDEPEVVLKKLIFEQSSPSVEPVWVRKECLRHYLELQRALVCDLSNAEREATEAQVEPSPMKEVLQRFMLCDSIGAGFAGILLDRRAEFEAVLNEGWLPTASHDFLALALTVAQENSGEIFRDDNFGVPFETMCGLYALSGGKLLLKFNQAEDAETGRGHTELLCNFLGDASFRDTLVALSIRGVIAAIGAAAQKRPGLRDPKTLSDEVLRIIRDERDYVIPTICRVIPGLVESAAVVLAGFCNLEGIETEIADQGLLAHMHVIPGFGRADLGRAEAGRGRQIAQRYEALQMRSKGMEYALPTIIARAAMQGDSMEGYFSEMCAEYERGSEKISNATECITKLRRCIPTPEHPALRELVYNAFAAGVRSMLGDEPQRYSREAFFGIASGATERASALLAYRASELPENLCFSRLVGNKLSECFKAGTDILGVSDSLYPAFRGVARSQLLDHNESRRDDNAQLTSTRPLTDVAGTSSGAMHELAERETARVTRELHNASGVGARLKAGSRVRAHYMRGSHTDDDSITGSVESLVSQTSSSSPTVFGSPRSASPVGDDRAVTPEERFFSTNFGQPTGSSEFLASQTPSAEPVGVVPAQESLTDSVSGSLPYLSVTTAARDDSRSASPVETNNSFATEVESDESEEQFFSVDFGRSMEPAGVESLVSQTSSSSPTVFGSPRSASPVGDDRAVTPEERFFSTNLEPPVEPAGAAPAREGLSVQGVRSTGLTSDSSTDYSLSATTQSGSLNSLLSAVAASQSPRSASPVSDGRAATPDITEDEGRMPSVGSPVAGSVESLTSQILSAESAGVVPAQEELGEEGFDAVDAASGPSTELQHTAASRVGGRSRRSSLSEASDVSVVGEHVEHVREEALLGRDGTTDPRVVLILEEFDANTLPNTYPIKARMLAAVRQSAGSADVTFYQQRVEPPENGCNAHTFCVTNGKSFKVAPDVHVALPGRGIDDLLSEVRPSPMATKMVIKVPNTAGNSVLRNGKLNFQQQEFDVAGLAFPAVREINRDSLMSLMLNSYVAHTQGADLRGHRAFDTYVELQRQLCEDFIQHVGERGDAMIAPNREWPEFIGSFMGSKFVNDVKEYMRSFRNVHDAMPSSHYKERLHSVMTSISHNIVDAGITGTSLEVLKALHALSSPNYSVDCTNAAMEERVKAITKKFLTDDKFGMVLTMVAMESCLTALAVHVERSRSSGGSTREALRATLDSIVPDICRRVPGLTEGMVGLLQRVMGISHEGGVVDQGGRQSAIVENVEKWVSGAQDTAEEVSSGLSLNQYLGYANAAYMRNAIVACAQARAVQRGDGSNRQSHYSEVIQGFLGGDPDSVPNVTECEERIGEAIAGLNDDALAELVADSVARMVHKNLVNPPGLVFGSEENLIHAFDGYFRHGQSVNDAVQFACDLSTHSRRVVSKFLAAEREIVREFLPSIMSSHTDVLFTPEPTAPCEVLVCSPTQSAPDVASRAHNHRERIEEEQMPCGAQPSR